MNVEGKRVRRMENLKAQCNEFQKSLVQSEDRFNKLFHASSNLMMITTLEDEEYRR